MELSPLSHNAVWVKYCILSLSLMIESWFFSFSVKLNRHSTNCLPSVGKKIQFCVGISETNWCECQKNVNKCIPVLSTGARRKIYGAEDCHYQLHPRSVIPGLHLEATSSSGRRSGGQRITMVRNCESWWFNSSWWLRNQYKYASAMTATK